jgi:hypothetical protein
MSPSCTWKGFVVQQYVEFRELQKVSGGDGSIDIPR